MELRNLKFFIAVAETLSFTKAADRLHVSQPSVSRQVRELEDELRVPLLVRDRQRVRLTDHGRLVLAQARAVLGEVAAITAIANGAPTTTEITLRVGLAMPMARSTQPLVSEFARGFPGVDVHYKDIAPEEQDKPLRQGEVDVGIFYLPFDRRQLDSELLFTEGFRVVLPQTSPLARRTGLRLKDLEDELILLLEEAETSNRILLQRAHKNHVRLRFSPTASTPLHAGSALVASGRGIYVLPGSPVTFNFPFLGPDIAVVPLEEPICREIHIVWRTGEESPTVLSFLETARKVFKKSATRSHYGKV